MIAHGFVTYDCSATSTQEFKDYQTRLHYSDVTVADYEKL